MDGQDVLIRELTADWGHALADRPAAPEPARADGDSAWRAEAKRKLHLLFERIEREYQGRAEWACM